MSDLQAAAVDQIFGSIIAAGGLQDDFFAAIENADHSLRQANIAVGVAHLVGVSRGDFAVVDDAGLRHVERL